MVYGEEASASLSASSHVHCSVRKGIGGNRLNVSAAFDDGAPGARPEMEPPIVSRKDG